MSKKEEKEPEARPFFHKKTVKETVEHGKVKLFLFSNADVEGAPVITGFPNIGITPVLTCNYLVEDLDLPLIGGGNAEEMPCNAVISGNGQPSFSIRIFGDKRLVIICSELKIPDNVISDLSRSLILFGQKIKSQTLWCVEGVPVEEVDKIEREELQFLTTSQEMSKKLKDLGHKTLHDAVVAGVTGAVLSHAACFGGDLDFTCILAPTSSFYPDAWASVIFIRLLNSIYDTWTSDLTKLEKSASELENKVKKLLSNNLRRSGSFSNSMYR